MNNVPVIATTAMLATLKISQWSGRKFDRNATAKVTKEASADADSARVYKALVSKDALKDVKRIAGELRNEFYRRTLPWGDQGTRILPAKDYEDFTAHVLDKRSEFRQAVETFLTDFDREVGSARHRLGDLFDWDDYPARWELEMAFGISFEVMPVPTAGDFRVELSDSAANAVRAATESRIERLTADAARHVWDQLKEMLTAIRDRLKDPDARFKNALITNFLQLAGSLDKLNVTEDANLTRMYDEVSSGLLSLRDVDALRKDKATRQSAVQDVENVLDKFAGVW